MVCNRCGSNVSDGLKFCPSCGNSLTMVTNNPQSSNIYNNIYEDNNAFNNNQLNDNKNKLYIVIIIVASLALIAGFIIYKNKKKDDNANESNSNSQVVSNSNTSNVTSNVPSNTTSNVTPSNITSNVTPSNITSNVTPSNITSNVTPSVSQKTVKFEGFLFKIPNTYTVSANTSQLTLMGKDNVHVVVVDTINGNYSELKNNNKLLVNQMKSSGYTVGKVKVRKYGKVEFIILPVALKNQKMVMAYSKLTKNKIALLAFANTSYTLDYSQFPTFAQMIQTTKVAK